MDRIDTTCAIITGSKPRFEHGLIEATPDIEFEDFEPHHPLRARYKSRLSNLTGLQDLSQARASWGEQAAEGFLSLFQTKLILPGVSDPKTLEAVSLVLGEYDRQLVSSTVGVTAISLVPGVVADKTSILPN